MRNLKSWGTVLNNSWTSIKVKVKKQLKRARLKRKAIERDKKKKKKIKKSNKEMKVLVYANKVLSGRKDPKYNKCIVW